MEAYLAPLGSTMKLLRILLVLACALSLLSGAPQRKKSKKEEQTQTLQVPQELPGAVTGETRRLTFHVTPLSAKGLLSQQIRDALKAVARDSGNETVLKIRAFVAGSGDLRRVRDLVSESFTEHHQPLPSLSLIQSGGLPLEGAQVIMEYVASSRKELHPQGLAFLSAQPAYSDNPTDPLPPLTGKSLAALRQAVKAAGSEPSDVLRVSCFLSSLENLAASRDQVVSEYPKASLNFVQTERAPAQAMAACEAVSSLRRRIEAPLQFVNVEGIPPQPGESAAALVACAARRADRQSGFLRLRGEGRAARIRTAQARDRPGGRHDPRCRFRALLPALARYRGTSAKDSRRVFRRRPPPGGFAADLREPAFDGRGFRGGCGRGEKLARYSSRIASSGSRRVAIRAG